MTTLVSEAPVTAIPDEVSLLGRALHRSRNITLSIRAYAELISDPETDPTRREEWARRILGQLDRLDTMYERMDCLRPSAERAGRISLALALRTAARRVESATPVEFEVEVDPHVNADAEEITQALAEVLRNACEASPAHGAVVARIEVDPLGHWSLSIRNDGEGMGVQAHERAGEPFFSQKPGHLGLGVFTSRTLLARQGLDLSLADRPEGGVVATIRQQALSTGGIR